MLCYGVRHVRSVPFGSTESIHARSEPTQREIHELYND